MALNEELSVSSERGPARTVLKSPSEGRTKAPSRTSVPPLVPRRSPKRPEQSTQKHVDEAFEREEVVEFARYYFDNVQDIAPDAGFFGAPTDVLNDNHDRLDDLL